MEKIRTLNFNNPRDYKKILYIITKYLTEIEQNEFLFYTHKYKNTINFIFEAKKLKSIDIVYKNNGFYLKQFEINKK